MPQPPDAIRVDRSELRRMFNDAGFFEKVQRGQLLTGDGVTPIVSCRHWRTAVYAQRHLRLRNA